MLAIFFSEFPIHPTERFSSLRAQERPRPRTDETTEKLHTLTTNYTKLVRDNLRKREEYSRHENKQEKTVGFDKYDLVATYESYYLLFQVK